MTELHVYEPSADELACTFGGRAPVRRVARVAKRYLRGAEAYEGVHARLRRIAADL